ncbi:HNH endonuclease [Nocardioides perillae]|uniref:HNH nuclease domain-containing protein n=1 Tax=Nocardioides perillae TaxID=1119534 RepID=A0A7Y9RWH4_9ACTN|nr:DUF222 domain-containing protein [Nocardioides perillae]NYG55937.1 hypothetical protein [Nocardioides perillae]
MPTPTTPQELAELALAATTADDCVVLVRERSAANLRWAGNTLTTNGVVSGSSTTVVSFVRTGEGTATGSVTGPASAVSRPGPRGSGPRTCNGALAFERDFDYTTSMIRHADRLLALREAVDVLRTLAATTLTGVTTDETDEADETDDDRLDLLSTLADLVPAACAATLRTAARHDATRRTQRAAAGVPAAQQGRGVALEIALATRTSPHCAQRRLSTAKLLLAEMPHTFARLTDATLTERQATALLAHTAGVDLAIRTAVDEQLCADPDMLTGLGERQVDAEAARLVARLDPAGVAARAAKAARDRHVTSRPAPDTMCRVSALLPVAQGVAVIAALRAAADTARTTGDPRTRGQVMADTLVQRTTGQTTAQAVPLAVGLLLPATTALPTPDATSAGSTGATLEPAWLTGHGPLDALTTRELLTHAWSDDHARAASTLRRLFTDPASGALVAMDTRSRAVPTGLAAFVHTRDLGICRTPWCDAPIRHTDHAHDHARGGATSEPNLQGLCEACNYAKQAPGWHHQPLTDQPAPTRAGPHHVEVTTPTGRTYLSRSPDLPGAPRAPAWPQGSTVYVYLDGPRVHLDGDFTTAA